MKSESRVIRRMSNFPEQSNLEPEQSNLEPERSNLEGARLGSLRCDLEIANGRTSKLAERILGFVCLLLLATGTAVSQPPTFVERIGPDNPFSFIVGDIPAPTLVDLDTDGDLDLVLGTGTLANPISEGSAPQFFENWKNARAAAYTQLTGTDSPFHPFVSTATADGAVTFLPALKSSGVTFDAAIGGNDGTLVHVTGVAASHPNHPSLSMLPVESIFSGIDVGDDSKASLVDLDADGDLDLIVGARNGTLSYWENVVSIPIYDGYDFVERTGSENPFFGLALPSPTVPTCGDLDNDGDFDCVVGVGPRYLENVGSPTTPSFVVRSGPLSPFDGWSPIAEAAPALGDLDADGDLDLVIGTIEAGGIVRFFENTSELTTDLEWVIGPEDPFDFYQPTGAFRGWMDPVFVDLDGDNDLDCVIGNLDGLVDYLENIGSKSDPMFVERTGSANPMGALSISSRAFITFADLDADGDQDFMIAGGFNGKKFYRNEGTRTEPSFVFQGLQGFSVLGSLGDDLTPEFVDIDGDSDYDLVFGRKAGDFVFLENVGTPQAEFYVQRNGLHPANRVVMHTMDPPPDEYACNSLPENGPVGCFGLFRTPAFSSMTFGDVDGDGDLDAAVGENSGKVTYLENVGSRFEAVFAQRATGSFLAGVLTLGSPGINELGYSQPVFVDIEADGDLDLVLGQVTAKLQFYRNNAPLILLFADGFESGTTSEWSGMVP